MPFICTLFVLVITAAGGLDPPPPTLLPTATGDGGGATRRSRAQSYVVELPCNKCECEVGGGIERKRKREI